MAVYTSGGRTRPTRLSSISGIPTVSTVEKTTLARFARRSDASTVSKSPPYPPARSSAVFMAVPAARAHVGGGPERSRLWCVAHPRSAS